MERTSERSSILTAKPEPLGRLTRRRFPSSERMLEVSRSDPREGLVLTNASTACFHLRWSSPASVTAGVTGADGAGAGDGACLAGAGADLGAGTAWDTLCGAGATCWTGGCDAGAGEGAGAEAGFDAGAGAATGAAEFAGWTTAFAESCATWRSSWLTRSARESSVMSLLGRARRVRAISSTRRWLVAVRISLPASLMTASAREMRSTEPKARASSLRFCSSSSVASTTPGFAPTADTTYTSRRCPASSRENCRRSRPDVTSPETASNRVGTFLSAIAQATLTSIDPETSPRRSCAESIEMFPSPNTESFSSVESASRMPPRAWRTIRLRALLSKAKPSCAQMSSRWASMSSEPIALKSKRCTRERMVSGIFWGSVVHSTNTTCDGGSSSVLSSALKAAVVSMWTSSMI